MSARCQESGENQRDHFLSHQHLVFLALMTSSGSMSVKVLTAPESVFDVILCLLLGRMKSLATGQGIFQTIIFFISLCFKFIVKSV